MRSWRTCNNRRRGDIDTVRRTDKFMALCGSQFARMGGYDKRWSLNTLVANGFHPLITVKEWGGP